MVENVVRTRQQSVHCCRPGAEVRMRDEHDRVFAFFLKLELPDLELVFHSGTCRLLDLAKTASSRFSASLSSKW